MNTILVVDDEISAQRSFRMILKDLYRVVLAGDGKEALEAVGKEDVDLVILDIMLPGIDGIEVLRKIKKIDSEIPVVMVTATKTIKSAVEAIKAGAYDYITKPFDVDEITITIEKALKEKGLASEVKYLRRELGKDYDVGNIVGESPQLKEIHRLIAQVAPTKSTVLISGESGTGKELVARAIHFNSPRRDRPFIVVHCAALTETLLESELFGHEKGAFTDAHQRKPGRFELADGGTLFLDEISEMSPSLQVKLLRVLQEQEFMRVGGTKTIKVDVRLVCATNRDLKKLIEEDRFREDLYYRINVVPVFLPPLRERGDDVALLANEFLKKYKQELSSPARTIADETIALLKDYSWPGNIRELENAIERAVVLATRPTIMPLDLPVPIQKISNTTRLKESVLAGELSLEEAKANFERELIKDALERTGGVQTETAKVLKTTRRILKYRMDKLGIG